MKAVKNGEISQLSSVIKSLESKIVSLETQIQYSKNNYDELIELLKPLLHDLLDKSEGQRVARKNQMRFKQVMVLLYATGFIKSASATYGGQQNSEIGRILELITGYSKEEFRKALSKGEIEISPIDRDSADTPKQQMLDHLMKLKCKLTADKVDELW